MKLLYWVLIATIPLLGVGCSKMKATPKPPKMLQPATIKDIMDSMVDPSGDFVFNSVEEVSDEHGVRRIVPSDTTYTLNAGTLPDQYNADTWESVRLRLMVLIEAPNLLVMPGRKVAPPNTKTQNPDIELSPTKIQKAIDSNRPLFIQRAHNLQLAAETALKAVNEKNVNALFQAEDGIDHACESCHLHYWYPNDARARQIAKEEGIKY